MEKGVLFLEAENRYFVCFPLHFFVENFPRINWSLLISFVFNEHQTTSTKAFVGIELPVFFFQEKRFFFTFQTLFYSALAVDLRPSPAIGWQFYFISLDLWDYGASLTRNQEKETAEKMIQVSFGPKFVFRLPIVLISLLIDLMFFPPPTSLSNSFSLIAIKSHKKTSLEEYIVYGSDSKKNMKEYREEEKEIK